jgi:hypothetical protein
MQTEEAKTLEKILTEALEETARCLLQRAKEGNITSAEAAVVAKMCKDNNINTDVLEGVTNNNVGAEMDATEDDGLTNTLPFPKVKAV